LHLARLEIKPQHEVDINAVKTGVYQQRTTMEPIIKTFHMTSRVYGKTVTLGPTVLIARDAGAATRV
jgi:hypothetical protein